MEGAALVSQITQEIHGTPYQIHVYCREARQFYALTSLGGDDIIICDGGSFEEALERQREVLPLAVSSRTIRDEFRKSVGASSDCTC